MMFIDVNLRMQIHKVLSYSSCLEEVGTSEAMVFVDIFFPWLNELKVESFLLLFFVVLAEKYYSPIFGNFSVYWNFHILFSS